MNEKIYYSTVDRALNLRLYGPFESEELAGKAGAVHRSEEHFRTYLRRFETWGAFRNGVSRYDENEIASLTASPQENGYKSFKVFPASAMKVHVSWKRIFLYNNDGTRRPNGMAELQRYIDETYNEARNYRRRSS